MKAAGIDLEVPSAERAGALCAAVTESVAELRPFMPWCHADYSVDDARSWIDSTLRGRSEGTAFEFLIADPSDGSVLGVCGLNQIDPVNQRANLGYWVRTSATGQGVATAAVRKLAEWAFGATGLIRLEIVASIRNASSCRVAEKAGAAREGIARSRLLLHGDPHDAVVYSFVR